MLSFINFCITVKIRNTTAKSLLKRISLKEKQRAIWLHVNLRQHQLTQNRRAVSASTLHVITWNNKTSILFLNSNCRCCNYTFMVYCISKGFLIPVDCQWVVSRLFKQFDTVLEFYQTRSSINCLPSPATVRDVKGEGPYMCICSKNSSCFSWLKFPRTWFSEAVIPLDRTWHLEKSVRRICLWQPQITVAQWERGVWGRKWLLFI